MYDFYKMKKNELTKVGFYSNIFASIGGVTIAGIAGSILGTSGLAALIVS